jgi:hypothetical protein
MSAPDAMHGEMPGFPSPGRPGGEHDEPLLDMIFDGRAIPPDAPQEMHDLARMLAALAGPVEPGELAGEAAARNAFIRLASPAGVSPAGARHGPRQAPRRPASHRLSRRRPARRRAGLAAALWVAAAGLAGTAAAYAGVLPAPIQQMAHVTVGAPAPHHHGSPTATVSGSRRDASHGPRPGGQPGPAARRPAGAAMAPGYADVARPHREPPRGGPQAALSCDPWADQGPPGITHGFPSPSLQPHLPRCPAAPPGPAGGTAMDRHRPG